MCVATSQQPFQRLSLSYYTCRKHSSDETPRKHTLRHEKLFKCVQRDCDRSVTGFGTQNDLDRHTKSVHSVHIQGYSCAITDCRKKGKIWPRLDNFRQHCTRLHPDSDTSRLIEDSRVTAQSKAATPALSTELEQDTHSKQLLLPASGSSVDSSHAHQDESLQSVDPILPSSTTSKRSEGLDRGLHSRHTRVMIKCTYCRQSKLKVCDDNGSVSFQKLIWWLAVQTVRPQLGFPTTEVRLLYFSWSSMYTWL